jgi:hypothetical protein
MYLTYPILTIMSLVKNYTMPFNVTYASLSYASQNNFEQ